MRRRPRDTPNGGAQEFNQDPFLCRKVLLDQAAIQGANYRATLRERLNWLANDSMDDLARASSALTTNGVRKIDRPNTAETRCTALDMAEFTEHRCLRCFIAFRCRCTALKLRTGR